MQVDCFVPPRGTFTAFLACTQQQWWDVRLQRSTTTKTLLFCPMLTFYQEQLWGLCETQRLTRSHKLGILFTCLQGPDSTFPPEITFPNNRGPGTESLINSVYRGRRHHGPRRKKAQQLICRLASLVKQAPVWGIRSGAFTKSVDAHKKETHQLLLKSVH